MVLGIKNRQRQLAMMLWRIVFIVECPLAALVLSGAVAATDVWRAQLQMLGFSACDAFAPETK